MPSEVEQINEIFSNFGIPLSMEWLESCIEWCKSDNLPPNYTLRNLQNMVYEQWLILDLRDVEIRTLPTDLSLEKKYSLAGVYYLQLMQVIDISKPKLWQLQRIRNKVAKNTETEKDFGKRVLQLTLTDGVQDIQAMEFKPVAGLNINLSPGSKLKIIGPIMVRNGRLMLEPGNVKFLGGSVDDLTVTCAAENVLARALRLEENPNPHVIDEKILDVNEASAVIQTNSRLNQQNSNVPAQTQNQINQNQPRNNQLATQNASRINIPTSNRPKVINQEIPPEFEVDDELLRELEEDFEENSVRDFKKCVTNTQSSTDPKRNKDSINPNLNKSNRTCTSPDLFEQMEFDNELLNEHLDHNMVIAGITNTKATALTGTGTTKILSGSKATSYNTGQSTSRVQDVAINNSKPKNDEGVITLDDSFDDIDIDSHLDHLDEEMANLPCSTQKVRDFKEQVKSPVLKKSAPKVSLSAKRLTQSKLIFGGSTANKKFPDNNSVSSKGKCLDDDADANDFENPFSIFTKSQKRPPSFVPLDISTGVSKKSSRDLKAAHASPEVKNSPALPKINVMTIEKLKKMLPNINKGKFKIKAKFQTVTEKLRTIENTFHLVVTVIDGTGELTVEMHSDIVAGFAEIKPEKLIEIKELVVRNDPEAKSVIYQALTKLHARCTALDNVMELQINRGDKYPIVVNVIED